MQAHTNAQIFRERGALLDARQALLSCAQSSCPALVVDDCVQWMRELDRSMPSVVFAISDLNGQDVLRPRVSRKSQSGSTLIEHTPGRVVPLDPGIYAFRVEAQGYEAAEREVLIREAEQNRILRFELSPSQTGPARETARPLQAGSASPPAAVYWLGGAAAVGLVVGATFGVLTEVERAELNDVCAAGPPCPEGAATLSTGNTYRTVSLIATGVGAASLAAGAAVWLLAGSDPQRGESALPLHPVLYPQGAQLQWRQRF